MREMGKKVILDANMLMASIQFKVDIFEELERLLGNPEPIILSTTTGELQRLTTEKSEKTCRQALYALALAKKCGVVYVEKEEKETPDEAILRVARSLKCLVATNDKDLRKRLRNEGIPTIFLRQKKRLEIEGYA